MSAISILKGAAKTRLFSLLCLGAASLFFFVILLQPIETNEALFADATSVPAIVTIGNEEIAKPVPDDFLGISLEKKYLASDHNVFDVSRHPAFARLLTNLGPGSVRIGGNTIGAMYWEGCGVQKSLSRNSLITNTGIAQLAVFSRATGWGVIYGVDMAKTPPACVANEVAAVAAAFARVGGHLQAIEVGNEPNLYRNVNGTHVYTTFSSYEEAWQTYADAIRQKVPGIPLAGPDTPTSSVVNWGVSLAQTNRNRPDIITQHYYRSEAGMSIAHATIGAPVAWTDRQKQQWNDWLLSGYANKNGHGTDILQAMSQLEATGVPYRIDETNAYNGGHKNGADGVTDSFASGLWALDFAMQAALRNADGINFHTGGAFKGFITSASKQSPSAPATGYAPIYLDPVDYDIKEVRPEYYALLLLSQMAHGPIVETRLSSTANAAAYTIRRPGGYDVLVINKDRGHSLATSVTLPGVITAASQVVLQAPSLDSAPTFSDPTGPTTINGQQIPLDGKPVSLVATPLFHSGSTLYIAVSTASAVMLHISTKR